MIDLALTILADYTQTQKDWAKSLYSPYPAHQWCSDLADATLLYTDQQDIRKGADGQNHWFAMIGEDWVQVPDDAVIPGGNAFNEPIVWYNKSRAVTIIRCFVPGALF